MASLAKTCRAFHLKLKKAERKSGQLKMQNDELKAAVKGGTSVDLTSSRLVLILKFCNILVIIMYVMIHTISIHICYIVFFSVTKRMKTMNQIFDKERKVAEQGLPQLTQKRRRVAVACSQMQQFFLQFLLVERLYYQNSNKKIKKSIYYMFSF